MTFLTFTIFWSNLSAVRKISVVHYSLCTYAFICLKGMDFFNVVYSIWHTEINSDSEGDRTIVLKWWIWKSAIYIWRKSTSRLMLDLLRYNQILRNGKMYWALSRRLFTFPQKPVCFQRLLSIVVACFVGHMGRYVSKVPARQHIDVPSSYLSNDANFGFTFLSRWGGFIYVGMISRTLFNLTTN